MALACTAAPAGNIDEMMARVAAESPALATVRADIEAELSRAGFARLSWRPEVTMTWAARRFQDSSAPTPTMESQGKPGGTLSWLVWDWGATTARVSAENHDIRASIAKHRRRFVDTLHDAGRLYVDAWAARQRVRIMADAEQCATQAVTAARERKRGNVAPESAIRATETELMTITADRMEARADETRALAALSRYVTLSAVTDRPTIADASPHRAPPPELEEAIMLGLKAGSEYAAASRARLPRIDAVGSLDHETGKTYSDAMIGARVRVDLFDQAGNDLRRTKAIADRNAARVKIDAVDRDMSARIAGIEARDRAAEMARNHAAITARLERFRIDDARADALAGKADWRPVAQACKRIATAERQVIDATARRILAKVELRAALGDLP